MYSVYDQDYDEEFSARTSSQKAAINNLKPDDLGAYKHGDGVKLDLGAIQYSDAIIRGEEDLPEEVDEALGATDKKVLAFQEEDFVPGYMELYQELLPKVEEEPAEEA